MSITLQFFLFRACLPSFLPGVWGPLALISCFFLPLLVGNWPSCYRLYSDPTAVKGERAPPVAWFQKNWEGETFGEVLPPPSSFGFNVAIPTPARETRSRHCVPMGYSYPGPQLCCKRIAKFNAHLLNASRLTR